MERAGREFFERVREGYLAIAKDDPARMVVIDGARDRAAIHDDILRVLRDRTSLPL
jgi:thymidylate kinase